MGIDSELAVNEVDEELICSICRGILEDPVEIKDCEHMFCDGCIRPSIQEKNQIKLHVLRNNFIFFCNYL